LKFSPEDRELLRMRTKFEKYLYDTYKLSRNAYDFLLIKQLGRCRMCDNYDDLVVDHDHSTGKVRGLLCSRHNTGIGQFRDNIQELQRAIDYLSETLTQGGELPTRPMCTCV
jgi:hypothetical protein